MLGLTVADDIKEARLNICNLCQHKKIVVGIEYCGICKCAILMKAATKLASCPEGKWGQDK